MTEKEKLISGQPHNPNDSELAFDRLNTRKVCRQLNTCNYNQVQNYLKQLIPNLRGIIDPPFVCDYGYRIYVGPGSFINAGATFLDAGQIYIGSNVFIGPNCNIYAATHPIDQVTRLHTAIPQNVVIEDNAWLGGNVTILGNIKICSGSIIGAGSVVTKSVPPNEVWAGNPAKFIRKIQ
jgi:maltose O-acetyltransferase